MQFLARLLQPDCGGCTSSDIYGTPSPAGKAASSSGRAQDASRPHISLHGTPIPLDFLVQSHDPKKYPQGAVCTPKQLKEARKDFMWSCQREQVFAAVAAGIHVAMFAYNLAFWGSEGMPQDRYWPANTRWVPIVYRHCIST